MDLPVGLILHKDNMYEIEYILNSLIQSKTKEHDLCYISINTKSYVSKFSCDKIRIFKFNDLYRLTFNKKDYENTSNTDYQCFSVSEEYNGIFKFTIFFSEGYYGYKKQTYFEVHLSQFSI